MPNALPLAARVKKAKELLQNGKEFPSGCSEFVCEVLEIKQENAESLLGESPTYLGEMQNYAYDKLTAGDVVGWKSKDNSNRDSHVAIYIGEDDIKFIHVPGRGGKPKPMKKGFELKDKLYKSSKY